VHQHKHFMNIDKPQSASEQQDSSLPSTSNDIWAATRNFRPTSPSELSDHSEQLSSVSNLESTPSLPGNSPASPLHSNPQSTMTYRLSHNISNPTNCLPIPQLPTESALHRPKMTNLMCHISSLAQMPYTVLSMHHHSLKESIDE